MALSLKTIASNCLDLSPPFSVIENVFGYKFRDSTGNIFGIQQRTMSLKRQLELIQGPSLDLNLIRVGIELFDESDHAEIQFGVQFTRDIYEKVDLGIRKLNWQYISEDDAGDYVTINSSSEAHDLTDDWNGLEGALDVFVVELIVGAGGWSMVDAPCSKDDKDKMTGVVTELSGSVFTGTSFAHEIGHYLGLPHDGSPTNFMGANDGTPNTGATGITASQGDDMKNHCYVEDIC